MADEKREEAPGKGGEEQERGQVMRHETDMTRGAGAWINHILRFIVAALILMLVGYIVPGFSRLTFVNALIAAIAIAVIGYMIELVAGRNISPYGHGIVGFIVSAIVIYGAQFFVPGMSVSIIGALLAAVVIGIIDLFVPTKVT